MAIPNIASRASRKELSSVIGLDVVTPNLFVAITSVTLWPLSRMFLEPTCSSHQISVGTLDLSLVTFIFFLSSRVRSHSDGMNDHSHRFYPELAQRFLDSGHSLPYEGFRLGAVAHLGDRVATPQFGIALPELVEMFVLLLRRDVPQVHNSQVFRSQAHR